MQCQFIEKNPLKTFFAAENFKNVWGIQHIILSAANDNPINAAIKTRGMN